MNIEEKDIITLNDDKRYLVVRKINFEKKIYYYIANVDSPLEVKYLFESGDKLIQVHNDDELVKVVKELTKTIDVELLLSQIEK